VYLETQVMSFSRVKEILDKVLADWQANNQVIPDLSRHRTSGKPPFSWKTAAELRAAWGKGVQLIQLDVIGNGNGARANLVVDLKSGLGGRPRMPLGGPYLTDAEIQEIVAWIDNGCPDEPGTPDRTTVLKFGGTELGLTKSDNLLAIRPNPGTASAMERTLEETAPEAAFAESLGGFRIISVERNADTSNWKLDALRADPTIAAGSHVFHTSNDGVPFVPTGSIYVVFKPDVPDDRQEQLIDSQGLEIVDARGEGKFIVRITDKSPNPIKVAQALQQSPEVAVCEPELATPAASHAFSPPSGGMIADQWHLRNVGRHRGSAVGFREGADARVIDAWIAASSLGSSSVILAVIDDGFDLRHPDLSAPGKVVHPWDFTRNSADPAPDPGQGDWHGTACAGVALAQAAAMGVYGAAPGVTLMPVRWGRNLSDSEIENWFGYVASRGAWVASCSWGATARNFPLSTRAKEAISNCVRNGRNGKGCVVLFAAGNENRNINDPAVSSVNGFAIHPDVIAVAASNSRDEKSNYSNFGAEISICAPSSGVGGWGVLTCDVTGTRTIGGSVQALGYAAGDYTYDFGGTSSATPLVAGVCALVLSKRPDLTAREAKEVLEQTARKIAGLGIGGRNDFFGYGCVDAASAISSI
jgi:subtilisin family serine protease